MKGREIFQRTIPEPWTILGLKLRTLSLGHILLLERFESAFLGYQRSDNPFEELAMAVFICSSTYEEAVEGMGNPTTPKVFQKWAKKLGVIDIAEKWKLFEEYLRSQELRFESGLDYVTATEGGTRSMRIPFAHAVRVKLQSRMSFSDVEILNRPWALCVLDYYVLADMEGIIALTDEDKLRIVVADTQAIGARVAELLKAGKVRF